MDLQFKEAFLEKWEKYFGAAELPIVFYYHKEIHNAIPVAPKAGRSCIICELEEVRNGTSLAYDGKAIKCGGGKRFLGYALNIRPNFEYFLSCGIPGKMEGERYKRTPEIVLEIQNQQKTIDAKDKYIIFKRWDKLEKFDEPAVVIFFAKPDVLSGLFTLANFDQAEPNGTFTPFGSGCSTIVAYPYLEKEAERPRAVIGMFDPSARPCVSKDTLTFAVPMVRFKEMVEMMDECFLITRTWETIRDRINTN